MEGSPTTKIIFVALLSKQLSQGKGLGGPGLVLFQQFSTEALVAILWVTDLVSTAPKITKPYLYELSSGNITYRRYSWCFQIMDGK